MMRAHPLEGQRYLVLEDDYLVACAIEDLLRSCGASVVGPALSLAQARALLAGNVALDGALLDVNLYGQTSFGLLEDLERVGVRCVFVTGYDAESIPDRYAHVPRVAKPMGRQEILAALRPCP